MPEPIARVVIEHGVDPAGGRKSGAQAAKESNKQLASEVRARRKVIHEQAERDIAGARLSSSEPTEPIETPVREDIEAIEITLRDGRVVNYGPPTGISLADRIARLYSGRALQEGGPDPGLT